MKAVSDEQDPRFYEFGPFRIDVTGRALLCDGEPVRLLPKSFDVLLFLVRNSGQLLDKELLINSLWPDSMVEENNLSQAISDVRRALGEGPKDQKYIVTVPRRGYRFAAGVKALGTTVEEFGAPNRNAAPMMTIAVLPFICLGSETDDEYLAVGMADALITRLSSLRKIVVRPTSSVLKYLEGDKDPILAGRELKVETIISGSIRKSGERIRVAVQLVSVRDESSLWAGHFDEKVTDIFAVEDSVSERVAAALALELTGDERRLLTRQHTADAAAYQLYLRGRYFWSRRTEDGMRQAVTCFQQAIEREPKYALAYAGLADVYVLLGIPNAVMGGLTPREVYPQGKAAATKALEIDEFLAEAHASLAHISFIYDWDWPRAEGEFKKSIELSPHYATSHHWYAMALTMMGRPDEALIEMKKAQELEPLSLIINANLGFILYLSRRYDEAAAQLQRATDLEPHFAATRYRLGLAYEAQGKYEKAIEEFEKVRILAGETPLGIGPAGYTYAVSGRKNEAPQVLEELMALSQSRYVSADIIAEIYAGLGEEGQALDWLEKAYQERSSRMTSLKMNPRWDRLRSDPRFDNIMRRIGLVP